MEGEEQQDKCPQENLHDTAKLTMRLNNLPKFVNASAVRQFVATHLKMASDLITCRKAPKWNYAFVSMRKEMDANTFTTMIKQLDGTLWKKQSISAKFESHPSQRSCPKDAAKKRTGNNESGIEKVLNDQVTPLWKLPYAEQLSLKHEEMAGVVEKIVKSPKWHSLEPIRPSPVIDGYRNKCEFSIGHDKSGNIAVGFVLSSFKDGELIIERPTDTLHVPAVAKALATHFEGYLVQKGGDAVFNHHTRKGLYRILLVRIHSDSIMVAPQLQQGVLNSDHELEMELEALRNHFSSFHLDPYLGVVSVYVQITGAVFHGIDMNSPFKLISGQPFVYESINNLKFQISPSSFFQVNPAATKVLYSTIRELVQCNGGGNRRILLDLCCGTGTIGMILSDLAEKVVGVELVPSAVSDANHNAALNGIQNIAFECGKVEDVLPKLIADIPLDYEIVVVLDPPRSGVHKSVIKTIRNVTRISHVVYVSCNPSAATPNFDDLCRPRSRNLTGNPFELLRAIPVDMFPHTKHCELALQFIRSEQTN